MESKELTDEELARIGARRMTDEEIQRLLRTLTAFGVYKSRTDFGTDTPVLKEEVCRACKTELSSTMDAYYGKSADAAAHCRGCRLKEEE